MLIRLTPRAPISISEQQYRIGLVLCAALFLSLATFRLGAPWRLVHEDTGVTATVFATAHLKLGLSITKGHDFYFNSQTGEIRPYAHHPPGPSLLLAGVFALLDTRSSAATRGLSLLFHSLSLILIIGYLRRSYGTSEALLGAFVLALIPMSSFFGRLVAPEPFVLPAMLIFVWSYFKLATSANSWRWVWGLAASALWGAFMDWAMFFAMLACLGHATVHWVHTRSIRFLQLGAVIAALGVVLFSIGLAHLYWAVGREGLDRLAAGLVSATTVAKQKPWWSVALHILSNIRRYFTDVVFASALVYLFLLVRRAFRGDSLRLQDHVNLTLFVMGVLNLLCFPNRARNHHYWSYYLLPFMVIACIETLAHFRALYPKAIKRIIVAALVLITISSGLTLYTRHTRSSAYTLKTVERLANFL